MSGSSAFGIDNGSRERHALTAFGLAPKRAVSLTGATRAATGHFPHLPFANCIADADDHRTLSLLRIVLGLLQVPRKTYCVAFALLRWMVPPDRRRHSHSTGP